MVDSSLVVRRSLLVVEDDERTALALAELLHADGFAVEMRAGGDGPALVLGSDAVPAVFVTALPGSDEAVAFLRSVRERSPTLPIAVITADTDRIRPLSGATEPPPAIFLKPLHYGAFRSTLARLVSA